MPPAVHPVRTIEDFNQKLKSGTLINSPRSITACHAEGVDPKEDLYYKETKDFVLQSKGDKEVAKIRLQKYEDRRQEKIERVRRRRQRMIDGEVDDLGMEPKVQRSSVTPIPGTRDLVANQSMDGTPRSPTLSNGNSTFRSMKSSDSGVGGDMSNKTAIEKQRLNKIMEKNLVVQRQTEDYVKRLKQQAKEREEEKRIREEKERLETMIRDEQARKKEQELQRARHKREAALAEARDAEMKARADKMKEFEEREQRRLAAIEEKRLLREIEMAEKREIVSQRSHLIHEQSNKLLEARKQDIEGKMDHAYQLKILQQEEKHQELLKRREISLQKTHETQRKRQRANQLLQERLGRYVDKEKHAEERQKMHEEEQKNFWMLKKLQEKERSEKLKLTLMQVRTEEQRHAQELEAKIMAENDIAKRLEQDRKQKAKLQQVQTDMVVFEKQDKVKEIQRQNDHKREVLKIKLDQKMEKIRRMAEETRSLAMDRQKFRKKMFAEKKFVHFNITPGPSDYVGCDIPLMDRGPKFRFGGPGARQHVDNASPGPAAYSPIKQRKKIGVKFEPRLDDKLMMKVHSNVTSMVNSPKSDTTRGADFKPGKAGTDGGAAGSEENRADEGLTSKELVSADMQARDSDNDDFEDV